MLASFEQLWDQSIWMRLGVLAVLALASAAVLRAIVRAIFARLARRSAFLADLEAKTSVPLDCKRPPTSPCSGWAQPLRYAPVHMGAKRWAGRTRAQVSTGR
jgi:hypothetical protein